MSNRRFFAGFLLATLLVAGVASYYASRHPDGLNAVARQTGFSNRQHTSPVSDGPLAGYSTRGIANAHVGRGVAGVTGCLLVLVIGGGLFRVLRRREVDAEVDHDGRHDPASTTSGA
jgi:hypothetical protein